MSRTRGAPWGLAWLAAAVLILGVELVAAWRSSEPYSFIRQAISDLGRTTCGPVDVYAGGPVEVCSPWWGLVDGGWVVAGLLVVVGAWALRAPLRLGGVTTGLLVAAGLLLVGVGAVPADVHEGTHAVLGVLGFLTQNLAMLLAGLGAGGRRRELARLGVVGGALGLLASLLLFVPAAQELFGLVERLAVHPFTAWLALAGWTALRSRSLPGPDGV